MQTPEEEDFNHVLYCDNEFNLRKDLLVELSDAGWTDEVIIRHCVDFDTYGIPEAHIRVFRYPSLDMSIHVYGPLLVFGRDRENNEDLMFKGKNAVADAVAFIQDAAAQTIVDRASESSSALKRKQRDQMFV
ncbi:hypothetical protein OF122_00295 [Pelagibacterium flavum]|uniref:Uncharacterized protein n=1 Tax=Pelagibacterium flavum TaxID=2984530 RepID=A0ABY6ISU0_9HYPH|nr:hypothetical protein [Pelagibacterium sp. YIM 151497]UYQ72270.1 hypothetical protein OF122_00295 [Pelagibacterium sp. YIM 151497]